MRRSDEVDVAPRLLPEIVARAVAGEQRAIQFVLPGFARHILRTMRTLHLGYAEVEDACAEALAAAWRGLPALREPKAVRIWLDRIVMSTVVRLARRRDRVLIRALPIEDVHPRELPHAPHRPTATFECRDALDAIAGKEAAALLWSTTCEGHSIRDVAACRGRPVPAIRMELRLVLDRVRSRAASASEVFLRSFGFFLVVGTPPAALYF